MDATDLSNGETVAAMLVPNLVALAAVVTRFVTSFKQFKKPFLDDYLAVFTIIVIMGYSSASTAALIQMKDPNITLWTAANYSVTGIVLTSTALWFTKATVLSLYIRLFYIKRWLRVTCYFTLTVTFILYLAATLYSAPVCTPPHDPALFDEAQQEAFLTNCMPRTYITSIWCCGISVVTDTLCFILPIPVIRGLHLPRSKRIGLGFVFATGIFAIAASALSLYYQYLPYSGASPDMAIAMIATSVECSSALIVSCAPIFPAFWSKYVVESALFTKLSSAWASTTRSLLSRKGGISSSSRFGASGGSFPKRASESGSDGPNSSRPSRAEGYRGPGEGRDVGLDTMDRSARQYGIAGVDNYGVGPERFSREV